MYSSIIMQGYARGLLNSMNLIMDWKRLMESIGKYMESYAWMNDVKKENYLNKKHMYESKRIDFIFWISSTHLPGIQRIY